MFDQVVKSEKSTTLYDQNFCDVIERSDKNLQTQYSGDTKVLLWRKNAPVLITSFDLKTKINIFYYIAKAYYLWIPIHWLIYIFVFFIVYRLNAFTLTFISVQWAQKTDSIGLFYLTATFFNSVSWKTIHVTVIIIIIIIIKLCWLQRFFSLSLVIRTYHPSVLVNHPVFAESWCSFCLKVNTGVFISRNPDKMNMFSNSAALLNMFILSGWFVRWEVRGRIHAVL